MKRNTLLVTAGLMILAIACKEKEDDVLKPVASPDVHYAPARSTEQIDTVYTTEDGVGPIKVKPTPTQGPVTNEVNQLPMLP